MSAGKHTPGPWRANCFLVTDANGEQVCHTGGTRYRGSAPQPHEAEANAKLIAAAPALADALEKRVRDNLENGGRETDSSWMAEACAALRAAGRLP